MWPRKWRISTLKTTRHWWMNSKTQINGQESFVHRFVIVHLLSVSDSLQPYGLQHTKLPCPSLSPRVCSSSCPLSRWYHPTISSFVSPFSSCPQFFPASAFFPVSQLFASGGQSIGASASGSVLLMNIQDWFPLRLTGLISLESKGLSRVFSNTAVQKHWSYRFSACIWISCPRAFVYTVSYGWITCPLFSFLLIKI